MVFAFHTLMHQYLIIIIDAYEYEFIIEYIEHDIIEHDFYKHKQCCCLWISFLFQHILV